VEAASMRRNSLPSNSIRHPHMIAAFAKHARLNANVDVQSMVHTQMGDCNVTRENRPCRQ